jgi:hypothetical protein
VYGLANTTVSILRGTTDDFYGDEIDAGTVIASSIPAFISSPSPSSFRPLILGTTVYPPSTQAPAIVREITCWMPSGTDVTNQDQVLDESWNVLYRVWLVTQQGYLAGLLPDLQLTLSRVTELLPM